MTALLRLDYVRSFLAGFVIAAAGMVTVVPGLGL
jgi:hypothetical protein